MSDNERTLGVLDMMLMRTSEVDAANDAKDDSKDDAKDDVQDRTFENGDGQSDLDRDSSASVLGVYPRITGGVFGLVLFAAMMQIN